MAGIMPNNTTTRARGFSMIGLLVSMVCIVVLFAIGMNAMNKAVTGEGTARRGTKCSIRGGTVFVSGLRHLPGDGRPGGRQFYHGQR